jgi:hypothetical protein
MKRKDVISRTDNNKKEYIFEKTLKISTTLTLLVMIFIFNIYSNKIEYIDAVDNQNVNTDNINDIDNDKPSINNNLNNANASNTNTDDEMNTSNNTNIENSININGYILPTIQTKENNE